MFGRRFAYQFEGPGAEGWTPPWSRRGWHRPHFHGMHHGHGPFGFGRGPFGPEAEGWGPHSEGRGWQGPHFFGMHRGPFGRGPFGFGRGPFGHGGFDPDGPGGHGHGHGPRFFGRGDLKFALLELLQERPMHGYEMMKALEEKSGGFYTPSPGSIYPTLQMLEDRGLVTASEVEGKKVYSITDAGRALLAEQQRGEGDFGGPPWRRGFGFGGHRASPEMQALRSEAMELARLFAIAGRASFSDPEQLARLRSIIERTRKELTDMIYSGSAQQGQEGQASSTNVDQV